MGLLKDMGSLLSRHGNTFELTPSDKKLIKTSWAPVKKDMGKNGVTLFITFFKNYPQHMHYFSFQETSLSKLEVDPMLKLHGLRVLKEIDAIVESIDNPETLLHALRQNALNHRKRRIDKMAYDDLRRTILATFANLVGGKIFTPEVAIAWDKALSALFHVITDINDERKCLCSNDDDPLRDPTHSKTRALPTTSKKAIGPPPGSPSSSAQK